MELINKFWPGPLSLVLEKRHCVPDVVTAGLSSVAVRCPRHEVARQLIRAAGVPVAAPSANRFGMVSPTTAAHVIEQFGDQLPIVLDDGPCRIGVESTVVSFVDSPHERPTLLRPGGVSLEEIEEVIGKIETRTNEDSRPTSPGQLSRHYGMIGWLSSIDAPSRWISHSEPCATRLERQALHNFSAVPRLVAVWRRSAQGDASCSRQLASDGGVQLRRRHEVIRGRVYDQRLGVGRRLLA